MAADPMESFIEYKATGNVNLRNEIVLKYMDIVRFTAVSLRNTYAKYADSEDVINEGVIALINAVDTFDPQRGVKFETYASLKVRGAIIDFVRKQDWVPRQVRHFSKELDNAYNELYNRLGRTPANSELAEYMEISPERLSKMMADMSGAMTLSFEELLYEDNFENFGETDYADKELYEKELKQILAEEIDRLNPKEKQVVALYYYEKLKFSEIAKVLGVTESRVCQIHSKAILQLKRRIQEYLNK